jgi:parallel beta-helix repeat protein
MEKDNPPGNQTNVSQTDTTHSIAAGHIEKVVIAPQQNRGFNGIHVSPAATNTLIERCHAFDNAGHGISVEGTNTTVVDSVSEGNGYLRRPPEKRTVLHMATKRPKPEPGI